MSSSDALVSICRLPTAVTAQGLLNKTLTTWRSRAPDPATAIGQDSFSSSLVGCMLTYAKQCDRFIQTSPGHKRTEIPVDFRITFKPRGKPANEKSSDESMEEAAGQGYLGRHPLPPQSDQILLLHAECQIGKTGAYLALIQILRDRLQPLLQVSTPEDDGSGFLPDPPQEFVAKPVPR